MGTRNISLRDAMYISLRGYGPESPYTLATWLEARDKFRQNEKAAMQQIHLKAFNPAETLNS